MATKTAAPGPGFLARRFITGCKGKFRYPTKNRAKNQLSIIPNKAPHLGPLMVYPCNFCYGWHIGHEKEPTD